MVTAKDKNEPKSADLGRTKFYLAAIFYLIATFNLDAISTLWSMVLIETFRSSALFTSLDDVAREGLSYLNFYRMIGSHLELVPYLVAPSSKNSSKYLLNFSFVD